MDKMKIGFCKLKIDDAQPNSPWPHHSSKQPVCDSGGEAQNQCCHGGQAGRFFCINPAFLCRGKRAYTAATMPRQCDEGADFMTFCIGLFGLDKWHHVDKTVANLAGALDRLGVKAPAEAVAA